MSKSAREERILNDDTIENVCDLWYANYGYTFPDKAVVDELCIKLKLIFGGQHE